MNEMRRLMEAVEEAYQGGKTEHSGAKKGKGAFYGRKKEAKRDSNKNRRQADKAAVKEEPGDWDHGYNYEGPQADDDVRYDPQPGDDEPLNKEVHNVGSVKVTMHNGEVTLTHGHGENIYLSQDEWREFLMATYENYLRQ